MTARKDPAKSGRPSLGHSEQILLKLHPDLLAYARQRAEASYVTVAEYLRQLIIADMKGQP